MKTVRGLLIGACALAMAVVGGVQAAGADTASPATGATVCSGPLAPGTYHGLIVKGLCIIKQGPVVVQGNVLVTKGSGFNAVSTATLSVNGNIFVGEGAIIGLGCSPEAGCKALTPDHFHGNIVAVDALDVIIQSGTINGNVVVSGGGGGMNCKQNPLLHSPNFSTIEDTSVYGNVLFASMRTCWFGLIRDHVHGNITLRGNGYADPDADEVVTNLIFGNVTCSGNTPEPQVGDSRGQPNVVFGSTKACPTLPVK